MKDNRYMSQTTAQQCAYPGCDQPIAARANDRGAKPKYCDDASHNPLNAHRERRKREADATGQRAEETGGQPVTIGLTRAAELVRKLEQLTTQHADTLTRAITELRTAADPESAEAEVYAARTTADQRIAAAEARLAEEINRRRDAETERDQARADRDQADDATAQAITRMEELQHELTTLHHDTTEQLTQLRAQTTAELDTARAAAQHDIGQAREQAERQVADATGRARQADQEAARAQQAETAAQQRADRAQAQAAEEIALVRADSRRERDEHRAATDARLAALEETRIALRIRAERAEADLDTARAEHQRLTEQLDQAAADTDQHPRPADNPSSRARRSPASTTSRTKKA
jgi:colicin import membrane protein